MGPKISGHKVEISHVGQIPIVLSRMASGKRQKRDEASIEIGPNWELT